MKQDDTPRFCFLDNTFRKNSSIPIFPVAWVHIPLDQREFCPLFDGSIIDSIWHTQDMGVFISLLLHRFFHLFERFLSWFVLMRDEWVGGETMSDFRFRVIHQMLVLIPIYSYEWHDCPRWKMSLKHAPSSVYREGVLSFFHLDHHRTWEQPPFLRHRVRVLVMDSRTALVITRKRKHQFEVSAL